MQRKWSQKTEECPAHGHCEWWCSLSAHRILCSRSSTSDVCSGFVMCTLTLQYYFFPSFVLFHSLNIINNRCARCDVQCTINVFVMVRVCSSSSSSSSFSYFHFIYFYHFFSLSCSVFGSIVLHPGSIRWMK